MSAEADAVCGAGYGERSDARVNTRNGYRYREFDTRAGTLDVAIPEAALRIVFFGLAARAPPPRGARPDHRAGHLVQRRPGGAVLDAVLKRITYVNEETGYTIARVASYRSGPDLLTVVGALLGCSRKRVCSRKRPCWSIEPSP
jgi:hypothetical protein